MIKKTRTFLILLFTILSLFSCNHRGEFLNLAICGSYAVPGMFCSDMRGDVFETKVLERDNNGRILFEYKTFNFISGKEDTAYVVCQSYDSEYVYFYEDRCYLLAYENTLNLDVLKSQNDWGKDLNYSKMTRRSSKLSLDLHPIGYSEHLSSDIVNACCKVLTLDREQIDTLLFIDYDGNGKELYLLSTTANINKRYFVITDSNLNIVLKEVTSNSDITYLPEFKTENDWKYGYL